jgi:hypothetical protein
VRTDQIADLIASHMPGIDPDDAYDAAEDPQIARAAEALLDVDDRAPADDPSGSVLFGYRLHALAALVLDHIGADRQLVARARELANQHQAELEQHLATHLDEHHRP